MAEQDGQDIQATTATMTPQERIWWAMSFEELYRHARSKYSGDGRKSGRIPIIKWLCEKEGNTPYMASTTRVVEATPIIRRPTLRSSGTISHPETILRTS